MLDLVEAGSSIFSIFSKESFWGLSFLDNPVTYRALVAVVIDTNLEYKL